MLNKVKTLEGYKLHSLEGEIGKVKDFYFDDQHWTIRYLIVDAGNWLIGRQVLISPHAVISLNRNDRDISVRLTKKQIEDSPPISDDKPVSRQFESHYNDYYGWTPYWGGPSIWGASPYSYMSGDYPNAVRDREREMETAREEEESWDPHLRSTHAVSGYHIQAADGEIGHVSDFIIDDKSWTIRYMVVDTRNWWPGKKVLVSPKWIERVSWGDSKVTVSLSRENIKLAPEYTEQTLLTRDYEVRLHRHYNRPVYWPDGEVAEVVPHQRGLPYADAASSDSRSAGTTARPSHCR
jgi:uncharacterized protein YrrD